MLTTVHWGRRKCTRVEIHLLTADGLEARLRPRDAAARKSHALTSARTCFAGPQSMLDVPIYGRISVLELFRPKVRPRGVAPRWACA